MLNCIHGHGPMTRINKKGIDIDFCPVCGGVWLDKGELEKLIELSNSTQTVNPMANAPELNFDSNNQQGNYNYAQTNQYPRKKKREGFLGDVFDFDIF